MYLVTETEQAKQRKYNLGFGEQYSININLTNLNLLFALQNKIIG